MNVRTILLWGSIAALSLIIACQNPSGPGQEVTTLPTHVRGQVLRSDNLSPIANAVIYDAGGLARDTSKTDGSFDLLYQLLSQTKTRIIGSRAGFGNDTSSVTLNPGIDTTIVLRLLADSTSPSGEVSSGKAANIVLISSSSENISIRGTGSNETALLMFEVRDSLGIPIGGSNKLTVNFSILGGPGGGEYVFPVSGVTDPLTGRVTTRVSSGTKAGVLQVFAKATVTGSPDLTIKSSPVKITISGGLPVADRFSLSRKPFNIAGGVYDNLRAQIMVIVGDKEGNPVQEGTAISFTTTGGIIQPNAVTDKDGIATVDLISGNPRPSNSVAVVTAKTIGDSGTVIEKSISVLFSGATRVLTPTSTVVIPDSGVATFQYRVQDPNGFPLVEGTSIALTVDGPGAGQLELSGDVNKTLEDTGDPTTTLFSATVRDKVLKGPAGAVTFKVSVTSQNGNYSITFPGLVLADTGQAPPVFTPGATAKSGYISNLTLAGISSSDVSIRGTGSNESTRLTFLARDSVGNAVDILKRAYVTFSYVFSGAPGGGEFLFPTGDSTDASGLVSTTFNAGTQAGVVQVIAQAVVGGRTIKSSPVSVTVYGGLPDLAHFTTRLSSTNMQGWIDDILPIGTVSVQIGDKYGNAVRPVDVYFSTSAGLISAKARTDADGHATATLWSGKPFPNDNGTPGLGHIRITTIGENNTTVTDSLPFLFSGFAKVTSLSVPNDTVRVFDGGSQDVDFSIGDVNGNPIAGGNVITVGVDGLGAPGVKLSGDISVTTIDTQDRNAQRYRFRVEDAAPGGGVSGDLVFTIRVNGVQIRKFYGILYPANQVSTIVPISARQPSQIAFISITNQDIYVAGTGSTENSVITYEVRDSLGVAIDKARRVFATFSLQFYPNNYVGGGMPPTVIPAADSSDDGGRIRTSIVSGTQAGVIQLVARVQLANGGVVVSQPVRVSVHAGFADQAHFTLLPGRYVFPGLDSFNQVPFTVVVGDTFSNPVQAGTAIYYNSQAGVMQTGTGNSLASYTDTRGIATATLFTVNPKPTVVPYYDPSIGRVGYHWIYAQTQGRAGKQIIDSVMVLWNKAPILGSGFPVAAITIPRGGTSAPINVTITDANGNPLCDGTTISVSFIFTSDVPGIAFGASGDLSSNLGFTMPNAGYARFPGPSITDFTFYVSDLSTGGGATLNQSVVIQVTVNSPGLSVRTFSFTGIVQ